MQLTKGEDAAFPQNLAGYKGIVLGYFGGAGAFNVWADSAWLQFKANMKIPIWVAPTGGKNGQDDAAIAVTALRRMGVPAGKVIMLDMEAPMVDKTYVEAFGKGLQAAGYKVWVYGSVSNVFKNPQLNGYAVADPTGTVHMYPHTGVRMTQYEFGDSTDEDVIRRWLVEQDDLWV
jgi:hypothetical protein